MKTLLTITLSITFGFLLATLVLGRRPAPIVGAADNCTSTNGDVNADGEKDISDAIAILSHLFLGDPTTLPALCAAPGKTASLPATGQKTCYGFDLAQGLMVEFPCGDAPCAGQDGSYKLGCPIENRYVDNNDGTVTDTCTGLMWQQATADINDDGQPEGTGDALVWCDALSYCQSLVYAGYDDWRLPNIRELQSIVDYGQMEPASDPAFDTLPQFYWSSTVFITAPDDVWGVGFNNGYVGIRVNFGDFDFSFNYVRAVRNI